MDIRPKHYGIARVISKRGYCSRSEAEKAVCDGRVTLNGHFVMNPETRILMDADITLDGELINEEKKIYLALYKPRGIITTANDEKGRKTVMDLVAPLGLPHIAPVGRLDAASEGLLLLTNDTAFANRILSPEHHWKKNITSRCKESLRKRIFRSWKTVCSYLRVFLGTNQSRCVWKVRCFSRKVKNELA
jgi:23S rRNA pseudouridine2605 synthase